MAARVPETDAVIDTKPYWGAAASRAEADYLCAVLNSRRMTELVNPVQSQGHFGPRGFYSLPFEFPIPLYDPHEDAHVALASLGNESASAACSTLTTVLASPHFSGGACRFASLAGCSTGSCWSSRGDRSWRTSAVDMVQGTRLPSRLARSGSCRHTRWLPMQLCS